MKKFIAGILSLALILSIFVIPASATEVTYTDTNGHWASSVIKIWTSRNIIQGFDGEFRPNDAITRGEFAVMLDRVMGYKSAATNSYTDLSEPAFYKDAVLKASYYGVLKGYPDKSVKPNANITREDAIVMMYRAFNFSPASGYSIKAKDAGSISDYAKDAVSLFESLGIVKGRGDGIIDPSSNITRAETIQLLDNFISDIYNSAGNYTANSGKFIVVNTPDVVLNNMTVEGSIVVAPGVGTGELTLNNVKVKGNLVVLGGGKNSIKITGESTVDGVVYIKQMDGEVRVYNSSGNMIACEVSTGTNDVILEGTFSNVVVEAEVEVKVSGTVNTLQVNSEANITNTGTITNLQLNAAADVTGSGTIANATISSSASGSTFEKEPTDIFAAEGVAVVVGGTSFVSDGEKLNPQPTGGGTGGTGGGGDPLPTVQATAATLNVGGSSVIATVNSNTATFDLINIPNSASVTGINVTTSTDTSLVITSVTPDGGSPIMYSKTISSLNSTVAVSEILGFGNTNVYLGTLRKAFGSGFTINGTLSKSGHTSSSVSLVINLGPLNGAETPNDYVNLVVTGTGVVATIKTGQGSTLCSEIGIATLVYTLFGEVPEYVSVAGTDGTWRTVSTEKSVIASDIAGLVSERTWSTLTLEDLIGKNIYFKKAGSSTIYTLTIS